MLTAVTTAGLLASLFGTALLPVARAADADDNVESVDIALAASETDDLLTDGATVYVTAGKAITFLLTITDTNDDDDDIVDSVVLSTTGTTFSGTLIDSLCNSGNGALSVSGKVLTVGCDYDADPDGDGTEVRSTDLTAKFNVVGPAAGSTATVTVTSAAEAETETINLIGVAAGVSGVPSGANTTMDLQCDPNDSDGSAAGGAGCWVTKVDYITIGGEIEYMLDVEDGLGINVTTYATTATITGGVAGVEIDDDAGTCDVDDVSSDVAIDDDGTMYVCVLSDGTESLPFTLTVTVGSLSYTRKIGVVGEIATLALAGPASVASLGHDNMVDAAQWAEEYADQYVVTAKDAAGNIIGNGGGDPLALKADGVEVVASRSGFNNSDEDGDNGNAEPDTDFDFAVTDGNGVSLSFGTDDEYWYMKSNMTGGSHDTDDWDGAFVDAKVYAGTRYGADALGDENYVVANPGDLAFNVPSDLCDAGDEGEVRKIKVVDDTGTISSNTVTTTCVNDAVKLSGFTASATSAVKNGSVTFTFSATDGEGRPVGIGAAAGITVTPSWEAASAATLSFYGATASLKYTMDVNSGSHFLIFSRTDNDPATTGNQTWSEKYTVSVTNAADAFTAPSFYKSTVVKARAVAIFPGAAGKTITFTVENARTGVVRTYYRKANADGKAWYTIAARGTYYVTALYDGNSTNTIRLVK